VRQRREQHISEIERTSNVEFTKAGPALRAPYETIDDRRSSHQE
jgi:hypothetical protein